MMMYRSIVQYIVLIKYLIKMHYKTLQYKFD